MDLQVVGSIGQLVASAIAALKSVREASEASDNLELKDRISKFYNTFHALQERAIELDVENRSLKDELAHKDELIGPVEPHGYFFFKDRPEHPLCPKCLQSQPRNPVFLTPSHAQNGGLSRNCTVCGYEHWETKPQPGQMQLRMY